MSPIDPEEWKKRVEELKKQGRDSIKPTLKQIVAVSKDRRPKKILRFTHHALLRFTQIDHKQAKRLPCGANAHLDQEESKYLRRLAYSFLKVFRDSKLINLPFRTVKGKFMKYGAKDCLYYKTEGGIIFTIIREKAADFMITCGQRSAERLKDCTPDLLMPDATGATYLLDITEIQVPYRLKKSAIQTAPLEIAGPWPHPLLFIEHNAKPKKNEDEWIEPEEGEITSDS